MRFTRRFVLACLGCAPGLPLLLRSGPAFAAVASVELSAQLRSLVADAHRARIFGCRYRAQVPGEAHLPVLTGLIRSSLGLGDIAAGG
jgi:hypothetical protein